MLKYIYILETKYKVLGFDGTYYKILYNGVDVLAHKYLSYINSEDEICIKYDKAEEVYGTVVDIDIIEYHKHAELLCCIVSSDTGNMLHFDPVVISPEYIRTKKINQILN